MDGNIETYPPMVETNDSNPAMRFRHKALGW
jgi:hypothetical protein